MSHKATLTDINNWFKDSVELTRPGRELSIRDRQYKDGQQWSEDELEILKKRNQPPSVINRIAPKFNFIFGQEIANRTDPKAFPVTFSEDDGAEAATDALRYVEEDQDFDKISSGVTEDVGVEGYGGVVVECIPRTGPDPIATDQQKSGIVDKLRGLVGAQQTTAGKVKYDIEINPLQWGEIFTDPHSQQADYLDSKYMGFVKWHDVLDAKANPLYEGKEEQIDLAKLSSNSGELGEHEDKPASNMTRNRDRVRIAVVFWHEGDNWYTGHFAPGADEWLVEPMLVPWRTDKGEAICPMLLTSCYIAREAGDEKPNMRYGIGRNWISPQDEVNARHVKMMHYLLMAFVMVEDGVLAEGGEAHAQEQFKRPDGLVKVARNAMQEKRIHVERNLDLANSQFQMLQHAMAMIDQVGPQMMPEGNAGSGRQDLIRQQFGAMQLGQFSDNLRDWKQRVYQMIWIVIQAKWTEEMWLRVRDDEDNNGYRFVALNRQMSRAERLQELQEKGTKVGAAMRQVGLPQFQADELVGKATQMAQQQQQAQLQEKGAQLEAAGQQLSQEQQQQMVQQAQEQLPQAISQILSQHPLMQQKLKRNDISQLHVDIKIEVVPDSITIQHEQFEMLVGFSKESKIPIPPELIIKASSFRDKPALLASLKQPPDPMAVQQMQLQMQGQQVSIAKMQSEIEKSKADIEKSKAETQKAQAQAQHALARIQESQAEARGIAAEAYKDQAHGGKLLAETREIEQEKPTTFSDVVRDEKDLAEAEKDRAVAAKATAEAVNTAANPGSLNGGAL